MISYLKGMAEVKNDKFVIVEVNGIGYKVFCSQGTLAKLPQEGEYIKLFTYLDLKERGIDLYGFWTSDELELFETLKKISGVGAKTALTLSSFGSLKGLKKAIDKQGQDLFKNMKGVGKKTIQKIILELTGKIKELAIKSGKEQAETLQALINLGFSKKEAEQALSTVPPEITNLEERVRAALKQMGK